MNKTSHTAAEAAEQLCEALSRVGHALGTVDTDALLAAEAELSGAIATMGAVTDVGDRAEALAATRRACTALLRCRRLGASFSGVARAMGRAGRAADEYDRAGSYVERAGVRSSVQIRA